ncbi:hypothetical protein HYW73_00155 [Candidatus Nomurabacteria bacterium]|nr:hypothetical protein [Candidatus Nomurabacteria bacterium]
MNQKGFANLVFIGGIIILLVLGGYFAWSKRPNNIDSSIILQVDTSNWKTYQNPIHSYSFKYPELSYSIDDSDPSGEGYAPAGKFGNFLWKNLGLDGAEQVFAVNVLSTPEWTTVGTDAEALKKGFEEGGIEKVAQLSREVNLQDKEFPGKEVGEIEIFSFYNGSGYGFTVTKVFTFGFNTDQKKDVIGGELVEGEKVIVYVTNGKDIYSIEFPNQDLERQILSTFKFIK